MNQPDELHRRIQQLEERLSLLSEASLRINESLDFDTVLQEVVDSARALTASRYGAITVFGRRLSGRRPTFIVSGLTEGGAPGAVGHVRRDWDSSSTSAGWRNPCGSRTYDGHLEALNMPDFLPPLSVRLPAGGPDSPPGGRGRHHLPGP